MPVKHSKAPSLPGVGRPRNLTKNAAGCDACPCCGAVWDGDRPWSTTIMNPAELAAKMGCSEQNITHRIRLGTIAAYPATGTGGRVAYLIPVVEASRVMREAGLKPGETEEAEDLGVPRG